MQTVNTLSEYDFVVLLDASASMNEETFSGSGVTRWDAMQETCLGFARDLAKIDDNGVDVVVFNGTGVQSFPGAGPDKVKEIFATLSPRSSTPLHKALAEGFKLAGKSDKKDFIIVFTDGVPDDKAAAAQLIIEAANKQSSDDALTLLFVQVGDDKSAAAYLQQLDDNLKGAKFDIVDTKTMEQANTYASTAELVIAAIND